MSVFENSKKITTVRALSTEPRQYLLVIRTGSKPYTNIPFPEIRQFDVLMNYYAEPANAAVGDIVVAGSLSKFDAAKQFFIETDLHRQYDGIYFFDDDVQPRYDLDDFFMHIERYAPDLAQASLSLDSQSGWRITLHCPSFIQRYTNFVECMAPYFSREYLTQMLHTFDWSYSVWGLDFFWGHNCPNAVVIDAFQMYHPPGSGNNFDYLKKFNVDPMTEYRAMRDRMGGGPYDLQQFDFITQPERSR